MRLVAERWPELHKFLVNEVRPVLDPYGCAYYNGMDRAVRLYGVEAVSMQLLYIANNLLPGNKAVSKELTRWSKRLDKENHEN